MSYKFIYIIREFALLGEGIYNSTVTEELNKYGADKWELVNVIPHPKNKKNGLYYFKSKIDWPED